MWLWRSLVLPVGMFVMYAGFLIGLNMITFGVGVEACDDPTVWRFPEECRIHLGDRVTGNGDRKRERFRLARDGDGGRYMPRRVMVYGPD